MGSRFHPTSMPGNAEHTHHIRVRSTQLEMTPGGTTVGDDYDGKLKAAEAQLEQLQQKREELERKKQELEAMNARKRDFMTSQVELTDKLSSAVTRIDRELFEMRQEMEDLEQCRVCFASHLDKLGKYTPESWTKDQLSTHLDRAMTTTDLAADEYEQAAAHFDGMRSGAIFGRSKGKRTGPGSSVVGEFAVQLRNGLAFNLPVLVLGGIALVVYILK